MSNVADRIKKQIQRTIQATRRRTETRAGAAGKPAGRINVARRANIKIATNVGESDATTDASATQVAPIRQTESGNSAEGTNRDDGRK